MNDAIIHLDRIEYFPLENSPLRRKRNVDDQTFHRYYCDDEDKNFTSTGSIVQLTMKIQSHRSILLDQSEIKTKIFFKSLNIPVRLNDGQIFDLKMKSCSTKNENLLSYRVGHCAGGLYPNDHKCVSYQYGSDPIQTIDCHLPSNPLNSLVVLLIHGGFWMSLYNRSIEDAVANDLVRLNLIVCNLDYRSFGNNGGFPNTFYDVSNGTDLLRTIAQEQGFNADRIIIVGHSAGGQLGGFLSGRFRLKPNQAGFSVNPLRPIAFVSQAGVNNMWDGCDQADITGDGAVMKFLGGNYHQYPQRYVQSSLAASTNPSIRDLYPSEFLPLNIPIQAITGSADDVVPITQTMDFVQQAKNAGDNCSEVIVPGEDHFVHLNPTSQSWNRTRAFILSFIQ